MKKINRVRIFYKFDRLDMACTRLIVHEASIY